MLAAIGAVSGAVPARSPKAILTSVLLAVDPDEGSTLTATDLEVGIRYRVLGVQADAKASVVLSPAKLSAILHNAEHDETIVLEVEEDAVTIKGLRWKSRLTTEDPDHFPEFPAFAGSTDHLEVAPADLRKGIRRTVFATDAESTRYALGGVLFEQGEGTLKMVATDGRRLAAQEMTAERTGDRANPGSPIVPLKALKLVDRLTADDDVPVRVAWSKDAAWFLLDRAEVYTRLVEGRFPRYQDVFPGSFETTVRTTAGALLNAVVQAAITTGDESRGIDFAFELDRAVLQSTTADVGDSRVELPVAIQGAALDCVTLDSRYAAEMLRCLDGATELSIRLIDAKNPVVFNTEERCNFVIMPLTRER